MDVPSGLGLPSETGGTAGSAFVIAVPDTAIATITRAARRCTCWRRVRIVRKRVMRIPSSVSARGSAFPRTTHAIDRRFPRGRTCPTGQLGADVLVFEKLRAQKNV